MSDGTLVKTRIKGGIWEGVLRAAEALELRLTHDGRQVGQVELEPHPAQPGDWVVRVPIPPQAIGEGVQTFLIEAPGRDSPMAQFSILAGEPVDADLRAEITLLRAELDLLKRAFRRHCADTM